MEFLENLNGLQSCPPPAAKAEDGLIVYRFTSIFPPRIEDFRSLRYLKPIANTGGFFNYPPDECERRSCSVFTNEQVALRLWKPKPGEKTRFSEMSLVRLRIRESDGVVRKEKRSHCSWWISRLFNPMNNECEEVLS